MKTLVLHPEDSPRRGPWTAQKWDSVVDLGKSSESAAAAWKELMGSAVTRLNEYRKSIEDPRQVGQILRQWFGTVVDKFGLDWWELVSIFAHPDLETAIALHRLVGQVPLKGDLYATRSAWPVSGVAWLLGREVRSFRGKSDAWSEMMRRLGALRRLSWTQIDEVLWDKYDADYRWRARLVKPHVPGTQPVVLVPSAYTNVSQAAAAYARLLPDENFLLVATRNSGLRFQPPGNVQLARLEEFVSAARDARELSDLEQGWSRLEKHFAAVPEMAMLHSLGALQPIPGLIRSGIVLRDAWIRVLDREPVNAVFCGDDSNWHTRIPVLLAKKRKLPTVDFHHGALDGRFLLKQLSSDMYLAKNEMEQDYLLRVCRLPAERVVVSGSEHSPRTTQKATEQQRNTILFFSEPSESLGGRPEEIYRELLPVLADIARQHGRRIVVKLHPFENVAERSRMVSAALGPDARDKVEVVGGRTTPELLASAWFGITLESTAVVDCARQGVPCFHCAWLVSTSFGYSEQYARFGVGRLLKSLDQVADIPRMLADESFLAKPPGLDAPAAPDVLKRWLTRHESAILTESR